MLKPPPENVRPRHGGQAGSPYDNDACELTQVLKAVFHTLVLPFILSLIFGPLTGLFYVGVVSFLYATIFRDRSETYWLALSMLILMSAMLFFAGLV